MIRKKIFKNIANCKISLHIMVVIISLIIWTPLWARDVRQTLVSTTLSRFDLSKNVSESGNKAARGKSISEKRGVHAAIIAN